MAKTYSGGIGIATGFKLSDPQPIVDYMVVDLISDLTTLPNQFIGMTSVVKEDDNLYIKKSTGWAIVSAAPATTTTQGIVKLAGDLAGTADLPTVPGLLLKENLTNKTDAITGSSSTKYTTENAVVNYVASTLTPLVKNQFVWTSGTQAFTLTQNYSQVYEVSINGVALHTDQYTLTAPNIVTILNTLNSGDYIVILFSTVAAGSLPYYTQAQVDTLLNAKMDKVRTTKIVSTTTYTLLSTDVDKILYFTSSSAITLTIPSGLTLGNCYEVFQQGTGQITFVGSGATLKYSSQELLSTSERYSLVGIDSITNATEEYHIYGQLTAI